MKIISLSTGNTYDINFNNRNGENSMACPDCDSLRRHKGSKSFSFNIVKKVGQCLNCNAKFVEFKPMIPKKEYKIPVWKNKTELSDRAVKWFESRMINQTTLNQMDICSATEFIPKTGKEESVICFPYYRAGELVNIKYRDGAKNFKMVSDAELILYNIDCIYEAESIVIVEGEIDMLSYLQAGVKNVVSVPNGAGAKNLDYLDSIIETLENKKFYLAVDNDLPGYELRQKLINRLGAENCLVVSFNDCKDANEYLQRYGVVKLSETIKSAKEAPVSGIIYSHDMNDNIYTLYTEGLKPGAKIGVQQLDDMITWECGRVLTVTGIPGHGKSEFVDWLITKLNLIHRWKAAYFSPENYPLQLHFSKIASKITGKSFDAKYLNQMEYEQVFNYIDENYTFIYPEDDVSIENILRKGKALVHKHGIKILVIDPYNKLEHSRNKGESETDYISRFMDMISMFAKQNDCLVIIVAHPRKMGKLKSDSGIFEIPTLYDINGSANFYNKTDYGVVVYRDYVEKTIKVVISKVKFKHLGYCGECRFEYNAVNGRFELPFTEHDYSNYLSGQPVQESMSFSEYSTSEVAPF